MPDADGSGSLSVSKWRGCLLYTSRMLRLKDPVAIGVAFGTASHAVGTAKALEIGEVEGAVSGVAVGVAGICTVMIALFI